MVPNVAQDESAGCVISGGQRNGGPGTGDVEMTDALRHRGDGGPELSGTIMEQEKPRGMTVSVEPATFRMTPVGFAVYAEQFLKAAQSIPTDGKFTPVPYYLYCRALELIFKAFLLAKGHRLSKLRKKYGHNLKALWKAARKDGLADAVPELPSEIGSVLALANPYYKGKAFEYFDFRRWAHGYEDLPSLDRIGDSTAMLIEKLKPYCIREA